MTLTLDLVGLGEPLVVLLPDRPGPLRSVQRFERAMGGAECNVLLGMARLGSHCGLISRVGEDEFGEFVLETLRAASIDLSQVVTDPTRHTGIYFKEVFPLNEHSRPVYYRQGSAATALEADTISTDYVQGARALHITGITALLSPMAYDAVDQALGIAHAAGVTTVFDPNLRKGLWGSRRAQQLLRPLLSKVDMYLGGEWESRELLDLHDTVSRRELAEELARFGPREVVLKRGPLGAVALGEDGDLYEQEALPAKFKDAVGAGDAFNAGYLHTRQRGGTVPEALRIAAICGSAVSSGQGDFETFPRRDDLRFYLDQIEEGHDHVQR